MSDTVHGLIAAGALERGDAAFIISPGGGAPLTYRGLHAAAEAMHAHLQGLGLARGAKVAFLMDNGPWTVQLLLGVMASGRVAVPLNAVAGPAQLRHVLGHSEAAAVFVAPRYRTRLKAELGAIGRSLRVITTSQRRGPHWAAHGPADSADSTDPAAAPPPDPRDPALLLYTSGSTGLPKGALLSHAAVVQGARNVVRGHGLTANDRALCVLPVYHINGAMVTVCAPLASGGATVMPRAFSARAFWPLIAEHGCTWTSLVPTMIKYLLERAAHEPYAFGEDARLAPFRFARSASAPLAPAVLRQWEQTYHVPMIETIGLTETAGTIATNPRPPAARKAGSVGLACGNEIHIAAADGARCAANTTGEILIRGANVLEGYYKNPAATAEAFRDGWFRSGDLGFFDDEGYLYVTGRIKELIIRGGENIAPREIDDVLYLHDAVREAAAVGVPHADYGEEVVACVVLREGARCSAEELRAFCSARIGDIKAPKAIYFLEQLPKGPSGKILRRELPRLIPHPPDDGAAAPPCRDCE